MEGYRTNWTDAHAAREAQLGSYIMGSAHAGSPYREQQNKTETIQQPTRKTTSHNPRPIQAVLRKQLVHPRPNRSSRHLPKPRPTGPYITQRALAQATVQASTQYNPTPPHRLPTSL